MIPYDFMISSTFTTKLDESLITPVSYSVQLRNVTMCQRDPIYTNRSTLQVRQLSVRQAFNRDLKLLAGSTSMRRTVKNWSL